MLSVPTLLSRIVASRGVHLETLNTMETDSFINALRRFICRRGKVRQLRSNQGSNFMGARTELKRALGELNNDAVNNFLLSQGCDWIEFKENVPHASHMDGLARTILSVQFVLANSYWFCCYINPLVVSLSFIFFYQSLFTLF